MTRAIITAAGGVWPEHFPEPLEVGVEAGIVWAIAPGFTGVNGYVLIPAEGHKWSTGVPGNVDAHVSAHGGVTYQEFPWIGFDTGHAGDMWESEYDPHGISLMTQTSHSRLWTTSLVALEAQDLARQLAAL